MSKRVSRSSKAGIIFPVTRIKRYTKKRTKLRMSFQASVYFAAVLEYLSEILDLASLAARQSKKRRIIPRHIFVVIAMDEELRELLKTVIIPQGGVLPHIHPQLLPNQEKKGSTSKKNLPYSFLVPLKSNECKSKSKNKSAAIKSPSKSTIDKNSIPVPSPSPVSANESSEEEEQVVNQTISDVKTLWEEQMYLGPKLILVQGNFTKIPTEAIINPTDADFHINSFIGHMLKSAGGEELMKKIQEFRASNGPLKPLDAVISSFKNTLVKHIIHCFGPNSDDKKPAEKLDELVEKCLSIADGKHLKSLAIPVFELSYLPDEQAGHVVLKTITNYFLSVTCTSLKELFLIVHDSCNCNSCKNMVAIMKEIHKE